MSNFSYRKITDRLTTDFRVRVMLNDKAKTVFHDVDGYEPLLTNISLPNPLVSFSRKGATVDVTGINEPSFTFSYIPAKRLHTQEVWAENIDLTYTVDNGLHLVESGESRYMDPLILLDKTQYSKEGLLLRRDTMYHNGVETLTSVPTQVDGLFKDDEHGLFKISIDFLIYDVLHNNILYVFKKCRMTVVPASIEVSGENFETYNVAVYADHVETE